MSGVSAMKLKQLYAVSLQIASRRTYCSRKLLTPALSMLNQVSHDSLRRRSIDMSLGRQGNYSKVPSRGVHANTSSIKEEAGGIMSAEDLEKRIKHLLVSCNALTWYQRVLLWPYQLNLSSNLSSIWQLKQNFASKIVTSLLNLISITSSSLPSWQ